MLQALARHALQVGIREFIGSDGTQVFMRHVRTRNALVISCKRQRYTILLIYRQGMLRTVYPEDDVVTSQADLNQHIALRHFAQQSERIALIHDAHAMSDTLGMPALDRVADVETQPLRRHQAHHQFPRMQADMHARI